MATAQLKFLLLNFFILSSQTTKGVFGECRTPPVNQAVYEGTKDIRMTCNSPNKVTWSFHPADDDDVTYVDIDRELSNLFEVNETNLIIKTAQTTYIKDSIFVRTTSGIYYTDDDDFGAKLVIVTLGPVCYRIAKDATSNDLICGFEYLDRFSSNPIYAKLTWTADGAVIREDVVSGIKTFSTIAVYANDKRTYNCSASFLPPILKNDYYKTATNAPDFTESCSPPSEFEAAT